MRASGLGVGVGVGCRRAEHSAFTPMEEIAGFDLEVDARGIAIEERILVVATGRALCSWLRWWSESKERPVRSPIGVTLSQ